jgi:hypothetical protein
MKLESIISIPVIDTKAACIQYDSGQFEAAILSILNIDPVSIIYLTGAECKYVSLIII